MFYRKERNWSNKGTIKNTERQECLVGTTKEITK